MSDTKSGDDKTLSVTPKKTLTLKTGGAAAPSTVRQSFSHGRTNNVVVETKKRKFSKPEDAVKAAAPAAPAARPPVLGWPFAALDYVGDINGPAASHGGYYAAERPFIKNVQQWLIYRGATTVDPARWATSTWADGKFERESMAAARKFFAGDRNADRIYSDDYAQLVR